MHKEAYKELSLYLVTMLGIILTWYVVLQVWRADWNVPFDYGTELGTDVLGISTWMKSYLEDGFSWKQTGISAPFFANRLEGFGIDRVVLLMEIISVHIFPTYGGALNFLYMLSFVLTGITTVYALRSLKFSRIVSFAGAIIYTFLQYHLMRGEMHMYLSFYHLVPLAVVVMLWLVDEKFLSERFSKCIFGRIKYAYVILGLFALLLGVENPYFAFFAAIGIAFAALYSLTHKHLKKMVESIGYLLVIIMATLVMNLEALFNSSDVAMKYMEQQRTVESIEFFGLKIINLLLPVQNHRLPILAKIRQHYDELVEVGFNEGTWISLGFVLSICFCIALINYLVHGKADRRISVSGSFILVYVLVSTVGGGSSVIGLFFSLLRCYNRMVVFIAMFCIIVLAVLLEKLEGFMAGKKIPRKIYAGLVVLLVFIAVWDQTTVENIYAYEATKEEYVQDEEFVEAIEDIAPQGSSIFQLPMMPSGTTSVEALKDYELAKPFLHAKSTKWLHLYVVGSQTDQWVNAIHRFPLRMVIDIIACCGFEGVYIDSCGYSQDEWKRVLEVMDSLDGTEVLWSKDGQKVFYSIEGYVTALKERLGADRLQEFAQFWLSCPAITCFPASQLHYTEEVKRQGDEVIMSSSCRQYGPYITVQEGDYVAFILGHDQKGVAYDVTFANGVSKIPIIIRDQGYGFIEYEFHVEEELESMELCCINEGKKDFSISAIILLNADQKEEIDLVKDFLKINY